MVLFDVLWVATLFLLSHAATYTNDWAIRIRGDVETVNRIAEKYGFTNMGQVGDLKSYYSFRHRETTARSTESNREVTAGVVKETEVEWLQQQVVQRRAKRNSRVNAGHSVDMKTTLFPAGRLDTNSTDSPHLSGPVRRSLWYTRCSEASRRCQSRMSVAAAWRRGYTGKGVVVSVLDDGIEREHPDLKPNYDPLASYDVNGQDQDPSPNYSNNPDNYHGTQCAGMVAATANNSRCTVGVSFYARIGGIRMLDGDVTDIIEAQSLSFRSLYIDIYVASWGPEDDGATLEGPGPLARRALHNGIKTGRHGRGSLFVWASGNGGQRGDHCSCDGYSSSIYTISMSSSALDGGQPDYLEQCSSTLATAYTGAEAHDIVTLGPQQSCSQAQPGTSLAASMAAGVIALTLEANPLLTWRDVQHIIVRTSKAHQLVAPDWHVNGAGYKVSHLYGFGLLDAERMVKEAERWKQVPPQHKCVEEAPIQLSRSIHPGSVLTSVYKTTGCSSEALQRVVYVEHVAVRVSIAHCRRGDLSVTLTSPSGTMSQLLANRPLDDSTEGFHNWEFMTTHCWGEQAAGEWTLKIQDTPSQRRESVELGVLKEWSLVIYGTAEQPYPVHRERVRSAEMPMDSDLTEEYNGPCDPECSDDGCEGPGPQQCVTCLHFFLKFKNNTRTCVSECPSGFWGERRRCKRCFSSCESCTGSRSDQCTSCQPGYHLTEETNTCTALCGDSYYLDHDANMCRKCSENCLKCTSNSICTECKQDTSLQGNRCQRSCAAGFYHDKLEGTCKPCHKACATCAGAGVGACSHCAEGYLMEEWRCVSSCSAGFYATEPNPEIADGHRLCRRCDASCLTCVGRLGNCSSCSSGHSLQEGVCVVNTVCADRQYPGSSGECHACHATCLKCTGPQSEDCVSCAPSWALDDGRCVQECGKGKYESNGQCHLCDHTCATCVDATAANCTSCDTDKFKLQRYLYNSQCLDACPEAFYHSPERSCESCPDHCQHCTGPTHCLQCDRLYYVSDGVCAKLECGEGEVEDPDYDNCMTCEKGCRTCILYNPRHCLSCIDGFYNFQEGCYKECPAKTYSVEEQMTCFPCKHNCVTCNKDECHWCETDLFLTEGRCVSVCPAGFYGNEDTNDCEECHADCVTCDGPEDDDCLSCGNGKTLDNGECVSDHDHVCPIRTFHSGGGECEACHASCESCSGDERNQCTACAEGQFLTPQQTCAASCPAGSFASRLSAACELCPPGCLQCVDAQRCTRCQSTRKAPLFLQSGQCVKQCVRGYPVGQVCRSCAAGCASCVRNATNCLACQEPLVLHQRQCVDECPPGHALRDGRCQRCPSACHECSARGECTGCDEYHFLHEGSCLSECPDGFYEDAAQCSGCHPDCALCDGPDSDDCDACTDPETTLHNGACVTDCPSHSYRDAATGQCEDCDASCLTCFSADAGACTSCTKGQRLDGQGHCVATGNKCPPYQYADQHGECHPCHKSCHSCSEPGKTHCLSCSQRHVLLNATCVDECPAGYYRDPTGQNCEACHPSCQSCFGKHSNECHVCKDHLFKEGKVCVRACHPGHYGNTVTGTCEKCDPSCGECIGGGEHGCLSCDLGLVFLRKEGRCLPSCPQGYYHDPVHRTCEPCHASCQTCSGKDAQSCESCYTGYRLSDGKCESMCDIGQYLSIKGSSHVCEDCDSSCLECRGPGSANCTMCPAQAILDAQGRCLLCCRQDDDDEEEAAAQQRECCNCTETRGECVLSTNLAFRNDEEDEPRGNLTIFIIACILLVLVLVAIVFLVRHSRSKSAPPDIPPRGYEKLGSGGGYSGGSRHGGFSSSSASYSSRAPSSGNRFQEAQLVDLSSRRSGSKDDDDDDEDEDIVYMGQDGTVYRKFRYGQLGEDNEDELEYDDESYTFR